jgi:hypothetical protein
MTMPGPEDEADAVEGAATESDTVEEAAARAAEEADAERPIGAARPDRTGPDGEPLGGEGS